MQTATAAAIDPLDEYKEGVCDGNGRPIPLAATAIDVSVEACFATVRTRRVFRNAESASIEATMTFPVPVDAVAHGLRVEIDGRVLAGHAEPKVQARATYEAALDAGKAAVLHEEALKGVHVLSIAHIPPGKEVAVEIGWSKPVSLHGATPSLRIPNTVAEIYGRLPLLPADDLVVHESHVFAAALSVRVAGGTARLDGRALEGDAPIEVRLDRPIDLAFALPAGGEIAGTAADGRRVALAIGRDGGGDGALRLGILFDRSGSTADSIDGGYFPPHGIDTWHAAMTGMKEALGGVRADDAFEVWQFDWDVQHLGRAKGPAVRRLLDRIAPPGGGTEAGQALRAATSCRSITDVLFITDGRTGAIPVQAFAGCGKRVSAVLCGANSLDAMIGHLCALTGGQIVVAASDNISEAIAAAIAGARRPPAAPPSAALEALPTELSTVRGGVAIRARWSQATGDGAAADAVGAYAAALAMPMMSEAAATRVAVAHGLCTHLTSLVVVDEAGEAQEGLPNQRKVPLSRPMESHASIMPAPPPPSFPMAAPRQAPSAARPEPVAVPLARPADAPARPAAAPPEVPVESAPPRAPVQADASPRPQVPAPEKLAALARVAAAIDWDGNANALSKGDLGDLSAADRAVVLAAAGHFEIVTLAWKTPGTSPIAVVIGLMALSMRHASHNADRLARRALAGLAVADVAHARALLGL